jgi:hypothetical protein
VCRAFDLPLDDVAAPSPLGENGGRGPGPPPAASGGAAGRGLTSTAVNLRHFVAEGREADRWYDYDWPRLCLDFGGWGKMNALDVLKKYFPTGTTEGDRNILPDVFILPAQLADVISAGIGNPRLMVGNKGVGKTAILDHLLRVSKNQKIPALLLLSDDFDLTKMSDSKDIGTLKRKMYESLVEAIGVHLGKGVSGLVDGPRRPAPQARCGEGCREGRHR